MTGSTASLAAVAMPGGQAEPERAARPAVAPLHEAPGETAAPGIAVARPSRWLRLRRAVASRRPQTASLLLQAIAGGALYLSYEGMHRLAVAAGYGPVQAAIWPLIVDGFVVHASRDILRAWRARQTVRTVADGLLIVLAAGASAAFQAAAAATERVFTHPPLLLVVSAHVVPPVAALLALALEVFAKYDHQQRADAHRHKRRATTGRGDATGSGTGTGTGIARQADAPGGSRDAGSKARGTRRDGDPAGVARLARQVEDAFIEREIRRGERLVAASLAVELEGDDRRKRRVQEMLRRLRIAPTPQQQVRIDRAHAAAGAPAPPADAEPSEAEVQP